MNNTPVIGAQGTRGKRMSGLPDLLSQSQSQFLQFLSLTFPVVSHVELNPYGCLQFSGDDAGSEILNGGERHAFTPDEQPAVVHAIHADLNAGDSNAGPEIGFCSYNRPDQVAYDLKGLFFRDSWINILKGSEVLGVLRISWFFPSAFVLCGYAFLPGLRERLYRGFLQLLRRRSRRRLMDFRGTFSGGSRWLPLYGLCRNGLSRSFPVTVMLAKHAFHRIPETGTAGAYDCLAGPDYTENTASGILKNLNFETLPAGIKV